MHTYVHRMHQSRPACIPVFAVGFDAGEGANWIEIATFTQEWQAVMLVSILNGGGSATDEVTIRNLLHARIRPA